MEYPAHPSSYIPAHLTDVLRRYAPAAEKLGMLTQEQLAVIYEQRWFGLWVPKLYGGLELSFSEALRTEEALAWADGSAGWTITLCSGANWFVGFLDPEAAKTVFVNEQTCLAGSGKPSGVATITADGYEVTGQWNYATGALHATVFTANCVIHKDGVALKDEAGHPLMQAFWFYKDEVQVIKNWHTIGMIATASEGFAIQQLRVPQNRRFSIDSSAATLPHPVYHFPFLQFAEATLAINYAGMAMHFLDLCEPAFEQKVKHPSPRFATPPPLMEKLDEAREKLNIARAAFYAATEEAWQEMLAHHTVTEQLLTAISTSSRHLATLARQTVDALYPYAGLPAANPTSEINRVWRDIHTASQHTLLTFPVE